MGQGIGITKTRVFHVKHLCGKEHFALAEHRGVAAETTQALRQQVRGAFAVLAQKAGKYAGEIEIMRAAIDEAGDASVVTCEVCGEPGRLAERNIFWSVKCAGPRELVAIRSAALARQLTSRSQPSPTSLELRSNELGAT